jgi:mRNA-degrading endonuclease HigB of HigAB toxin-antitoxin module
MEPAKEERDQMIKYAQATTTAAEAVLKRLQNKKFKTPADVQNSLGEEINKVIAP